MVLTAASIMLLTFRAERNAGLAVNFFRIVLIDSLYRTFLSADTALYAVLGGGWH